MGGARTTTIGRLRFKIFPFMYKKCPAGNYHKIDDRLCFCRCNEHYDNWHGGILDFRTGEEYIPYNQTLGNSLHEVWQQVKPFLRYNANKSTNDYTSVEDILITFMGFVGDKNRESTSDKSSR